MKLLHSNLKKGEIKVLAQNLDDLWYLSNIIEPNDLVQGKTFRKIKTGSGEQTDATKKSVFMKILAEKIEFGKHSNVLRVSGIIREAPEDIPLGQHHTFNIEENTAIEIIKERWLKYQLDKISEACEEKKSSILIIVHDREEAYFALFRKYGYEVIAHIEGNVTKKREDNAKTENFYASIIKNMKAYAERLQIKQIILASPSFWKEELMKELKDDEIKKIMIQATCSSATKNGIDEVIKRPEVKEALKHERTAREMNSVEELFTEIAKNNLAAYGIKECEKAVEMGAVRLLLITDNLILKSRNENFYRKIDWLMKQTEDTKGDVEIISTEHEGGMKLEGLGGIGAVLRFK